MSRRRKSIEKIEVMRNTTRLKLLFMHLNKCRVFYKYNRPKISESQMKTGKYPLKMQIHNAF